MIDIELNGSVPTHVERIAPQFSVDENGKITWVPGLIDYDASLFYRGKTVTNDEFNTLFLRNVYQGNYITDSLSELFDEHLDTAIYRSFTSDFNLVPSYVKSFGTADWGTVHEDGYYYITISASEHGFEPDDTETVLDKMNIDTEMYFLEDSTGKFFEVSQVETDTNNMVTLYTDDNTLSGFVVIRTNDKAYALASATIDATQVAGLAKVATSAKYTDLIDRLTPTGPDTRIAANAANIAALTSDTEYVDYPFVHNADFATNATNADYATNLLGSGTIQNQPISSIFETGSSYVKNATNATNVTTTINGNAITNIFEEDGVTVKNATNAVNATNASTATNADNATKINNLELKQDTNGILKIEDSIIAQKKLIWEGTLTNTGSNDYVTLTLSEGTINLGDTLFIESDNGYEKWVLDIANNIISGSAISSYAAYDSLIENTYGAFAIFTTQIDVYPVPSNNSVEIRLHKKVQLRFDFLTTGILDSSESSIYVGIPVSINRIYKIIK